MSFDLDALHAAELLWRAVSNQQQIAYQIMLDLGNRVRLMEAYSNRQVMF